MTDASLPMLDPIDAAFLRRAFPLEPVTEKMATEEAGSSPVAAEPTADAWPCVDGGKSVVSRLGAAAPDQWSGLADHVEGVCRGHRHMVAVAGGSRSEGRTTIVEGLVATLRARGRLVAHVRGPLAESSESLVTADGERPEIVIVDAGVWFPPGPIHRRRVELLSLGCDAVILVRRAAEPPCPARGAVLEQIGLRLLGEVETFAAPTEHSGDSSP